MTKSCDDSGAPTARAHAAERGGAALSNGHSGRRERSPNILDVTSNEHRRDIDVSRIGITNGAARRPSAVVCSEATPRAGDHASQYRGPPHATSCGAAPIHLSVRQSSGKY
ncbi:hypothetical protein EVAR_20101_1 [Eumeta japonica]|uniref:Uncharacterized protein n=1 Tax=Eumeta variegata TaxID=151549 RepID=A0A4C1V4J1_EUMVA|nr:hypothetical protein EVAR_20101_1 [Eumeta japonica]